MLTIEDQSLLEDVEKKESMGLSPRKVTTALSTALIDWGFPKTPFGASRCFVTLAKLG
jgi:hypothetical protein